MNGYWGPFKQAPNLLILLTDQQRTTQHYPAGWVQQNLPNLWAIMQGGVGFPNSMTNTTACSPARATPPCPRAAGAPSCAAPARSPASSMAADRSA